MTGEKRWWWCCETMMLGTDRCLLGEKVFGFCVFNDVMCPSVKISTCITVLSGTGFFFFMTLNSLTFTSSLSNVAYIAGLNCVTKTCKKQQLITKIVIHLVKREKTTYRAACSLFCFHIPLASPTNWQVQLCSSYNEGQRGTSMHQFETCWYFPFQEVTSFLLSVLVHL